MEQGLALDSYLTTMLAEIPPTELIEQQEQQEQLKVVPKLKKQQATQPQPAVKNQQKKVVEQVTLIPTATAVKPLVIMPGYAQEEFSALFFKVGNLVLAAPLTDLARTMRFDGKVTKIPQQPIWFMGLLADKETQIGILNMAYLVQGKSRAAQRSYLHKPLQNVIVTLDGKWGLACDEVLNITKVQPDKVRWRTDKQKKPWLVGTVIDELVAIVDVNALVPQRKRKNES
jgi:purine-binding chemotaxis protein CheW